MGRWSIFTPTTTDDEIQTQLDVNSEPRTFPKITRHLHQNNEYQFRHQNFIFTRKTYILPNDSEPYKSTYKEDDLYADYDPMVGIKIAAVLGAFLLMMTIHLFLRIRRKKRERKRQRRFMELARKTQEIMFGFDDYEKGLPRIEIDVLDATAEWVQSLENDDEEAVEDHDAQKQYLDVCFDDLGARLTPKSSLKKKERSATPSPSPSTKSLPEDEKRVTFDLSPRRAKRWSSFSGSHSKRYPGRRKCSSMYVRSTTRLEYEPLAVHKIQMQSDTRYVRGEKTRGEYTEVRTEHVTDCYR